MDNKGFTLIELIATIALLAVIAVISFVSINGVIKKSRVSDCENLVNNIKSVTKEYFSDNRYNLDSIETYMTSDKKYQISANVLITNNYLSGPIYNPFDNSAELNSNEIKINIELNNDYTVKNVIIGAPEILINCGSE